MKKSLLIYQIIGLTISTLLIVGGVMLEKTIVLIAGVVFLMCNIGSIIGYCVKEKRKKLLPIVIVLSIVATIAAFWYISNL